ncbi:MAG: hypothetical protein JO060_01670, partial [Candidatus Eremiobacteraeota bacterium]|nr:hypothetical protein [Candidatus Eremiobacteraeota bacterium]
MTSINYRQALIAGVGGAVCLLTAIAVTAMPTGTARVSRPSAAAGFVQRNVTPDILGLHHIVTIGSTVDPINGDQNPYGLDVAKSTSGKITAGDLVISNFNDGANNIQGLGTTLEVLHPTPGSKPQRLAQDTRLTGTASIALSPGDNPWVASFTANDEPVLDTSGNILVALAGAPFYIRPWGQAFSGTKGPYGVAAFYESNANNGSINRINITKNGNFKPQIIATGFGVNHGVAGNVLAPAGLNYDAKVDTLYIVDSKNNRVVA